MSVSGRELLASLPASLHATYLGDDTDAIVDITHDSRNVEPGMAFACIPGAAADGHDFAATAIDAGATLLVTQRRLDIEVPQVVVDDTRRALGPAASAVHGRPSQDLLVIGITGTNGKTTTAQMLASILRHTGRRTEVLGTLSGARTTPEATDLQRQLAGFVASGVEAVVMEVSSHAMVFHRVDAVEFDVVTFTNLGRDHLDLHGSMEAYFRAKAALFAPEFAPRGVTNIDDPSGQLLVDAATIDMTPFSRSDASDVVVGVASHSFIWRGLHVDVGIGGEFNVSNSLAALTTAAEIGIPVEDAAAGLADLTGVPGRFETVSDPSRHVVSVVVDYAHTPDGLDELMRTARAIAGDGRLISVFGSAGDRDPEKRAPMGAAGSRWAHVAIVTSDNPRTEDPTAIVDQVVAGVDPDDRDRVRAIVDRRAAIKAAIELAEPGDLVVIAGKGHEATQTIGTERRPFDDRVVARELLDALAHLEGEPS